jgi:hypothetical protein
LKKLDNSKFVVPGELYIHRFLAREGPPVYYIVWNKQSSKVFTDQKAILKHIKWPIKTPTGDAIREWFTQFEDPTAAEKELDMSRIYKEGWGPEAHEDTKMIT